MKVVGLSQAELARRVGLSQPTIYNLIHKGKKGSTKLHVIARVLRTTPAYLTGETDDPESDVPDEVMSPQDRADLALIQSLSSRDRETVRRLLLSLSDEHPTPTPASPPSLAAPTFHSPPRKFAAGGG